MNQGSTDAKAYLSFLEQAGMKLGLENIRTLLSRLGHPERRFPCVSVAGTNGKGSVAAMLSAIAREAGYRTGLFTSPHLVDCRERILIDGKMIPRDEFEELALLLARMRGLERQPTYFEAFTAMALEHFAENGVDLAVMEVGMGGRFDSTRAAEADLACITNISLEHTRFLGKTVPRIAAEKAGIIANGKQVVSGVSGKGREVVRQKAIERSAPLHEIGAECRIVAPDIETPLRTYHDLHLGLAGSHQWQNAAIAIRAAELLSVRFPAMTEGSIRRGLRSVHWPGRLQDLRVGSRKLLLDGAHNAAGIRILAGFLTEHHNPLRTILLMGLSSGRRAGIIARTILPRVREAIFCEPPDRRPVPLSRLRAAASRQGIESLAIADCSEAARTALLHADSSDTIVVTGSLYLVGAVMKLFGYRPFPEASPAPLRLAAAAQE